VTAAAGAGGVRPVRIGHFARLKLRIMRNGFRGRGWRVTLFVVGAVFGLYWAAIGFLLFASTGEADPQIHLLSASLGGGTIVLGWLLLPLVWFGVDTLDPARFAPFPISRRRLVSGLLVGSLLGIPPVCTLIATSGLVVGAGSRGGAGAAAVQALGVIGGLVLCVAVSRAVTSTFATMLRSRRSRDLAGLLLAGGVALLAPLQLAFLAAAREANWDRVAGVARVVGWTPFGAPYTAGLEIVDGRPWAAAAKLAITLAAIAALLWWWSRTLESAMAGAAGGTGPPKRMAAARGGAVAQLLPRALPGLRADEFAAVLARELRYWWRDAKRRANLISTAVVGLLVPLLLTVGWQVFEDEGPDAASLVLSPATVNLTLLFVGAFTPLILANQFGFDGTSYSAQVIAGVPGRLELRARSVAISLYLVPLLVLIGAGLGLLLGEPARIPAMCGLLLAGFGTGLVANHYLSILGAYALPETSNPFAVNTGAGVAKSLLSMLALAASYAMAAPLLVVAALLGDLWLWLGLPLGLGYGLAAAVLGAYAAGDVLDRRAPEVLAAVTPR
jgi:ABC-2 type transport system permease protein